MTVTGVRTSLEEFFFKPVSPYPAAVFRILLGLCVCATLVLLHGDWLNWFGVHGWISMETIAKAESGFRINLFSVVPRDDRWVEGLYWLFLAASVTMTVGLGTRVSTIIVFLGLDSVNQRMPLILHGGDVFLRSASFLMVFASSGAVLSADRWIRSMRMPMEDERPRLISPWPLRLIQYQVAVLYLAAFWWKAKGGTWWDGTALFYVLNLKGIRQFPLPHFFYGAWMERLGGWSGLAFEGLFPFLVWFRRFRRPMLVAGLVFHLSLEYTLNVPMFQWDVLSAYVLFLELG